MKMNKINIALIILIAGLILSCKSVSVKPQPQFGEWELCEVCKGSGLIEVYVNEGGERITRDKKKDEVVSCCASWLVLDSYKQEQYEEYKNENDGESAYGLPTETRKIKCYHCNGRGWVPVLDVE